MWQFTFRPAREARKASDLVKAIIGLPKAIFLHDLAGVWTRICDSKARNIITRPSTPHKAVIRLYLRTVPSFAVENLHIELNELCNRHDGSWEKVEQRSYLQFVHQRFQFWVSSVQGLNNVFKPHIRCKSMYWDNM